MDRSFKHHPTDVLQSAIHTLEQFANQKQIPELILKDGQIIPSHASSITQVIFAAFSRKKRLWQNAQKQQVTRAVMRAIGTVKRNQQFIVKLQQGNVQERQFAETALSAINRYNASLNQKKPNPFYRLLHFFYRLIGWPLNEEWKAQRIDLSVVDKIHAQQEVSGLHEVPCLTKEADAIRMKASTLLRQHGILFTSPAETLECVKSSPIRATIDSSSQTSTLHLTLSPIPGTTIKVSGSFRRSSHESIQPIADSFQLSLESHAGFPHASQHAGWAFSFPFVPAYPSLIDQIPHFKSLHLQQQRIQAALLPKGHLLDKAKQWHATKRKQAIKEKRAFTDKHQALTIAIVSASGKVINKDPIVEYFSLMEHLVDLYDYHSQTWEMINQYFFIKPLMRLQDAWMDPLSSLYDPQSGPIDQNARTILRQTSLDSFATINLLERNAADELERSRMHFISIMGKVLVEDAHAVILQPWAEVFECKAIHLSPFSQMLQAAVYKQLKAFVDELDEEYPHDLLDLLDQDIYLFTHPSESTHPIAAELQAYYSTVLT